MMDELLLVPGLWDKSRDFINSIRSFYEKNQRITPKQRAAIVGLYKKLFYSTGG